MKDKILKALAEDRNNYARDCNRRIAEENGRIKGADYMLQRFFDVLRTEEKKPEELEDCNSCKYVSYGIYDEPCSDCCHCKTSKFVRKETAANEEEKTI